MSSTEAEPDVEASVARIAAAMATEATRLAGTFPVIAEHFQREAARLLRLTG